MLRAANCFRDLFFIAWVNALGLAGHPSTGGVKHGEGQAAHGCCWEPGAELLPSAHCNLVSVQGGARGSLAPG